VLNLKTAKTPGVANLAAERYWRKAIRLSAIPFLNDCAGDRVPMRDRLDLPPEKR
jgi:hypothetical protein